MAIIGNGKMLPLKMFLTVPDGVENEFGELSDQL